MVELPLHASKDMREEALAEYGPGLYFLNNGYREIRTRAGHNSWSVDHGVRVWLMDGVAGIACAEEAVGRAEADAEVQRLVAQMTPWAPAVAALARADRLAASHDRIVQLRDEITRDTPNERIDWLLDRHPGLLTADERKLWWSHRQKIYNGLSVKATAVHGESLDARTEAMAAVPPRGALPPTPNSWAVPGSGPITQLWTRPLMELCAQAWAAARDEVEDSRGPMVRWAVDGGMSKSQLHQLTGMSRATIDRYLDQSK
ncbi:hypothetical protein [Kitasatospora sp. MBT63]|uniref:hypothetical protein n=1 Tax=Kitasatospora sp. MBT63 TaxID=1444768 RepID=UPI00053A59AD|nr:hypothetical protein [Kitasatospora sp. MBT63]